jgi:isoleucyl-tRNA synthetase
MSDPQNVKDTLNLPRTAFSMKAKLAQKEPEILKKWDAIGLYAKIRAKRKGSPTFVLHDGPPYANGSMACRSRSTSTSSSASGRRRCRSSRSATPAATMP